MKDINSLLGGKNPTPEIGIPITEPCTVETCIDEEPEPLVTPLPPHLLALKEKFAARLGDINKNTEPPRPVYTLNGKPWATPGNISALAAWSKMGKSSITGGILACTLPGKGDCFGFESENLTCKAVLHFDTEQSAFHHEKKLKLTASRVGVEALPPWLLSYQMSGVSLNFDLLKDFAELAAIEHGGIHSIILDGGIDFINDPNNFEESKEFIRKCMGLAQEYNTHILITLHINPNSQEGKTRGHFGSELDRKAETNLTIDVDKKNDGQRSIFAKNARDTYIPQNQGTNFTWDDDANGFISVALTEGGESTGGISDLCILERLKKPCLKLDIMDWLMQDGGVSKKTAERKIQTLISSKYISQSGKLRSYTLRVVTRGKELLKSSGRWNDEDDANEDTE